MFICKGIIISIFQNKMYIIPPCFRCISRELTV
nr:MAG TPA: hypothetical protein [Caudoviricetes sp.]